MSEIITRFSGLKSRSLEIKDFGRSLPESEDIRKAMANLNGCANWMLLKDYYTIGETRLSKTNTCKQHLLCPFCASRRAAKLVQKNMPKVESLLTENSNLIPVMITFTIKNQDDLSHAFSHLVDSFRRLQERRRDKLKKGRGRTEFSKVNGAFFSYEFTHSEEGGYHPHIHCAALLDDYIDQKKLSEEWKEITGDSFIVDIRKIKFRGEKQGENQNEVFDALSEVFKYALKFQDLEDDQVWHAWRTLRGKRLIGSFGSLWGLKMPDSLLDDDLTDLPFIERFYKFDRKSSAFNLRSFAHISEHGEIVNGTTLANGPTEGSHREKDLPRSFDYSYVSPPNAISNVLGQSPKTSVDVSEAEPSAPT